MKKICAVLAVLLGFCLPVHARGKVLGWCQDGNQTVTVASIVSTTRVQRSYVLNNTGCTVTVYKPGTVTVATIYSDSAGTPKANPFTAASSGQWFFYTDEQKVDVKFSGAGILAPFTLGDMFVGNTIWINARDFGAVCDGVTDDTAAISLAIAAAQSRSAGLIISSDDAGNLCKVTSGFSLHRRTMIGCLDGAGFSYASATGTFLLFGDNADLTWRIGGIKGCILAGNGGAADTSRAIQVGGGANNAQGVQIVGNDISGFGHGVVWAGDGDQSAFGVIVDRSNIHTNACNGLYGTSNVVPEASSVTNSFIFNNGNASATCSGVVVAASAGGNWHFVSNHFDNNGNGTLAQVHVPATAVGAFLDFSNNHFEQALQVASTHIACLTTAVYCELTISGGDMVGNPGAVPALMPPAVRWASAAVRIQGVKIQWPGGTATTSPVFIAGIASHGTVYTLVNNTIACTSGTAANCQILSSGAGAGFGAYSILGNTYFNYDTATTKTNLPNGSSGCSDIPVTPTTVGGHGELHCTGNWTTTGTLAVSGVIGAKQASPNSAYALDANGIIKVRNGYVEGIPNTAINATTYTTIGSVVTGVGILALIRDNMNGGSCLIITDAVNNGVTVVASVGVGTTYTTSGAPGATQVDLTFVAGILAAKGGSSRNGATLSVVQLWN